MSCLLALRRSLILAPQFFQKEFNLLWLIICIQILVVEIIKIPQPFFVILNLGRRYLATPENSNVIIHN